MKNQINKIYIALALLAIAGSSCSDEFLKEKRNFDKPDDSFYKNETRVDWYINNAFYDLYSAYKSPITTLVGSFKDEQTKMTEELGGVQKLIDPTRTLIDASDGSDYYGVPLSNKMVNNPYSRIREYNALIEEIDEKGANLDEEYRNRAKGQMYYLRGIQYFDLMRTYGGVPIVKSIQNASATDETIKLPRASVTEVVNQIVEDFDAAANLLPETWPASEYGRPTKGTALAQKSRVLLTHASPLFNKDWDNTGNERWQKALDAGLAAETALTQSGHGLYGNSAKDWAEMFLVNNSFNPEAINVRLLSDGHSGTSENNSWEKGIRLSSQDGGSGQSAPKEMIDLFPMADGSRPTVANGYDEFLFFLNRDPRFYRTFAFSGSKWGYKEDPESTIWAYRWLDGSQNNKAFFSDNNQVSSPALVRKMSNPNATNESGFQFSGTDIFEYRYAELLLNIAECYAAKGDVNNAMSYLKQIRKRVGIPATNNHGLGAFASKYEALEACLYERRVELAYEGKRFWDIQRWMLYNDDGTASNNTCEKLGVQPLNGTQRTGHYLQYKDITTSADPIADVRGDISVDPDAADFQDQLQNLATVYSNNFILEELVTPMDQVSNNPVQIDWKQHYYIWGLKSNILLQNDWLEQTKGWKDHNGAEGTFDYQE